MPRNYVPTGLPVGAPPKLTPEQKVEVYHAFEEYIEDNEYPTMPDFCAYNKVAKKYKLTTQNLKDWEQFTSLRKRLVDKQEQFTESQVMKGKLNPTWAIFKLKQPAFGWTDRQEIQHANDPDNPMPGALDKTFVDSFITQLKDVTSHQASTDK